MGRRNSKVPFDFAQGRLSTTLPGWAFEVKPV